VRETKSRDQGIGNKGRFGIEGKDRSALLFAEE
jgi:hypothetical protein